MRLSSSGLPPSSGSPVRNSAEVSQSGARHPPAYRMRRGAPPAEFSSSRKARLSQPCRVSRLETRKTAPLPSMRPSIARLRSEEHTSELQSLMRISYADFCLKKKTRKQTLDRKHKHEVSYRNQ